MKIQNFNQHKSRKLTRLTKEELDTMSKRNRRLSNKLY